MEVMGEGRVGSGIGLGLGLVHTVAGVRARAGAWYYG